MADLVRRLMGWFSTTCVPAVTMCAGTPEARMMQPAITERAALPVHRNTKRGGSFEGSGKPGRTGYWIVTTVPMGVSGYTV